MRNGQLSSSSAPSREKLLQFGRNQKESYIHKVSLNCLGARLTHAPRGFSFVKLKRAVDTLLCQQNLRILP